MTVAGVGFPTPSGAARARVGFASVHDDVSEIGHLVQLAGVANAQLNPFFAPGPPGAL